MNVLNDVLLELNELIIKNNSELITKKYLILIDLLKKVSNLDTKTFDNIYSCSMMLYKNNYTEESITILSMIYTFNKKMIRDFIFTSFINPSQNKLLNNYCLNTSKYKDLNLYFPSFEELELEFIPISKGKYFIFDIKQDVFNEIIHLGEESLSDTVSYTDDEFSDILFLDEYNINNINFSMKDLNDKTIYYLPSNPFKAFSFLKLSDICQQYLNNLIIFKSRDIMQRYFRRNLGISLPHVIISLNNKISSTFQDSIKSILSTEHLFRLTKEGRSTKNIILSICIPTWNRGNLVLENINSLLKSDYDCEIEFVVSNNGSNKYKKEYELIKNSTDSRIKYFEFDENKGVLSNFLNVINICNGEYAMLISDEDSVVLESLPHYMNILKNNKSIGVIRSATAKTYTNIQDNYFKGGNITFLHFFLNNNYISGAIYNKLLFNKYNLNDITLDNSNNESCIHYPHMWWDAFLSLKADCIEDSTILCSEGDSILKEQIEEGILEKDKSILDSVSLKLKGMPKYQTYESRIKQHHGFIELIKLLKINDINVILNAYSSLSWKTNFLVSLVKNKYRENNYDINTIYDELLICTISGIKNLEISIPQKYSTLLRHQIIRHNLQFR